MDKHKYLFDSALYLKFPMYLAGTDLSGLSLNAAYETNEREREWESPGGDSIVLHNIYNDVSPYRRNSAYAQRRLLLSVSKDFRKLVRISFAVISIFPTCFAT